MSETSGESERHLHAGPIRDTWTLLIEGMTPEANIGTRYGQWCDVCGISADQVKAEARRACGQQPHAWSDPGRAHVQLHLTVFGGPPSEQRTCLRCGEWQARSESSADWVTVGYVMPLWDPAEAVRDA